MGDGYYLKVVFRFDVGLREPDGHVVGVDINENKRHRGLGRWGGGG